MKFTNVTPYYPPSLNYFNETFDAEETISKNVELEKIQKFHDINYVEILRCSGFVNHPSRETNLIVEGEIFKNEQNKLIESMRLTLAEYLVKIRVWKDIDEAFREHDKIKSNRFRKMMNNS